MDTHSCKSVLIDLFNLPPLPNEQNTEESYMDVPYNYYIPDGKNSRLLDRTEWNSTERPWMVIQGSSLRFHIWSMLLAPNTLSWTVSQVV